MSCIQPSLLELGDAPGPRPLEGSVFRRELGRGAFVDLRPGFLAGASELFSSLVHSVCWREERRRMYDRVVAVPRLVSFYEEGRELPDGRLEEARRVIEAHYQAVLGEPLATAGLCLYRDGRDSVAWHGDTLGRGAVEDTLVAICSLGATRRFMLRPRGGGASLCFALGPGDLLVMGGSCQRTFEHAVPKTTRRVGPRISLQFRPAGVR